MVQVLVFTGAVRLVAAVVALVVQILVFTGAVRLVAAVVALVVQILVFTGAVRLVAAIVTLVVQVLVFTGAVRLVTAIVALVVQVFVFTGANVFLAAIVAVMVLVCIYMFAEVVITAVIAMVVLVGILTGTDGFGAAIVAGMVGVLILMLTEVVITAVIAMVVLVGILTGTDGFGAAIVAGMVGVLILMLTEVVITAVIAMVILVGILTGADGFGAAIVASMVLVCIYMLTKVVVTAVIAMVILVGILTGANVFLTTIVTLVIRICVHMPIHVHVILTAVTVTLVVMVFIDVVQNRNNILSNQNFLTVAAMASLCQTGFGAGGILSLIGNDILVIILIVITNHVIRQLLNCPILFKGCSIGCNSLDRAGSLLFHIGGHRYLCCLNMGLIIGTNTDCGAAGAVFAPVVFCIAPLVIVGILRTDNIIRLCLCPGFSEGCGIRNHTLNSTGCLDLNLGTHGYRCGFHMFTVVLTGTCCLADSTRFIPVVLCLIPAVGSFIHTAGNHLGFCRCPIHIKGCRKGRHSRMGAGCSGGTGSHLCGCVLHMFRFVLTETLCGAGRTILGPDHIGISPVMGIGIGVANDRIGLDCFCPTGEGGSVGNNLRLHTGCRGGCLKGHHCFCSIHMRLIICTGTACGANLAILRPVVINFGAPLMGIVLDAAGHRIGLGLRPGFCKVSRVSNDLRLGAGCHSSDFLRHGHGRSLNMPSVVLTGACCNTDSTVLSPGVICCIPVMLFRSNSAGNLLDLGYSPIVLGFCKDCSIGGYIRCRAGCLGAGDCHSGVQCFHMACISGTGTLCSAGKIILTPDILGLAPVMALCRDDGSASFIVAVFTVATCSSTLFGTGGILSGLIDQIMLVRIGFTNDVHSLIFRPGFLKVCRIGNNFFGDAICLGSYTMGDLRSSGLRMLCTVLTDAHSGTGFGGRFPGIGGTSPVMGILIHVAFEICSLGFSPVCIECCGVGADFLLHAGGSRLLHRGHVCSGSLLAHRAALIAASVGSSAGFGILVPVVGGSTPSMAILIHRTLIVHGLIFSPGDIEGCSVGAYFLLHTGGCCLLHVTHICVGSHGAHRAILIAAGAGSCAGLGGVIPLVGSFAPGVVIGIHITGNLQRLCGCPAHIELGGVGGHLLGGAGGGGGNFAADFGSGFLLMLRIVSTLTHSGAGGAILGPGHHSVIPAVDIGLGCAGDIVCHLSFCPIGEGGGVGNDFRLGAGCLGGDLGGHGTGLLLLVFTAAGADADSSTLGAVIAPDILYVAPVMAIFDHIAVIFAGLGDCPGYIECRGLGQLIGCHAVAGSLPAAAHCGFCGLGLLAAGADMLRSAGRTVIRPGVCGVAEAVDVFIHRIGNGNGSGLFFDPVGRKDCGVGDLLFSDAVCLHGFLGGGIDGFLLECVAAGTLTGALCGGGGIIIAPLDGNSAPVMAQLLNRLGVGITTVAGEGFHAVILTIGLGSNFRGMAVAGFILIVVLIAVAAVTGIGGVTLFSTGGSCDYCLVVMAQGFALSCTADGAGLGGGAVGGCPFVAQGCNFSLDNGHGVTD